MMYAIVYHGPLKEIQGSVKDLGIDSAAFTGYIHRILQISHTFSYYYLREEMTLEALTQASELIKDAMENTIALMADNRSSAFTTKYEHDIESAGKEKMDDKSE
jgi:hypothetical protein